MKKIVLIGAGGHALSVIDSIQLTKDYEIIGITELGKVVGDKVLGYEVIGDDSILTSVFDSGVEYAFVTVGSIGNTYSRKKLFGFLKDLGFSTPTIIDPSANIGSNVYLGEGVYVGKNVVVNTKSVIEDMAIINTGSIIEHGCHISEFVHIGPGAVICGDVRINACTHVGAGATVIQGVTIGNDSIIGIGSIVVNDIPSNIIAYGNPCKVVRHNR